MAAGRNCIILVFPLLGTLAAIVLSLIVILGGVRNTSVLRDIYFMRLNTSDIKISGLGSVENAAINSIAQAAGLSQFYTASLWNYCQGDFETNGSDVTAVVTKCSDPKAMYWFDIEQIIKDTIGTSVTVDLPSDVTDYQNTLRIASNVMFVAYIAGISVSTLELIVGLFSFHSRMSSCCTGIIGVIGFILLLIASGAATGIFTIFSKEFNNNLDSFGVSANTNSTALGLSWGATVASLWAAVWWLFSICCGSTRRSPKQEPEKEPFIGYNTPYNPTHHNAY